MSQNNLPYVTIEQTFDGPAPLVSGQFYPVYENSNRIIDSIAVRRISSGTVLNVHLPKSGGAIPVNDGDVIDLSRYNYTGDVWASVKTFIGTPGLGEDFATFLIAFREEK